MVFLFSGFYETYQFRRHATPTGLQQSSDPTPLTMPTPLSPSQQRLLLTICRNLTWAAEQTKLNTSRDSSATTKSDENWDAFLYIVVVLLFYAVSMLYLVVQYTRREREEAVLEHYYTEYVKREHFSRRCFAVDARTMRVVPDRASCAVVLPSAGRETAL